MAGVFASIEVELWAPEENTTSSAASLSERMERSGASPEVRDALERVTRSGPLLNVEFSTRSELTILEAFLVDLMARRDSEGEEPGVFFGGQELPEAFYRELAGWLEDHDFGILLNVTAQVDGAPGYYKLTGEVSESGIKWEYADFYEDE